MITDELIDRAIAKLRREGKLLVFPKNGVPTVKLPPKIRTDYWAKPIPVRTHDWSAVTDDYDLGHPIGYGRTESEAIADLVEQLEERANDS